MKKRIIILGTLVLFVVLAWTAGWYFIAGQVRSQVEMLALADGETTPQVTCETLNVVGFPFRFDIDCVNATVVSADLMVQVPGLRASVMVWRPTHVVASARGPATLSDAFTGLQQEISWSLLDASVRLDNWRIARLSVSGTDLAWNDRLFGETLIAKSPAIEMHLLDIPEQHNAETGRAALAGYLRAQDVEAPGMAVAATNAEVELEISALPDDIRNWGAVPFLQDWQQAGGTLRVVGIRASDGTADLTATGDLALDPQGYPVGSIAIDSIGVAERIGPFIEEPWRTLVLGVPGEDGRHKNQINFANGALSSGLVPIAQLAPLF
ncbi:hypothetical protein SAMN06295905_3580 [Devosia lucknowensis]|uniref:DUF2125 domain-containing protein n=1 Tax=Devosia lucknowensis TaxID=1096929 RepID=A0A1Y6G850_9HYPH|nr:DUF2125 domain-containing protein [Devosia lucknowensis]SMQ86276.1 hypothetical protein SAMN06295905_3580 [Devosia lucknowensis]